MFSRAPRMPPRCRETSEWGFPIWYILGSRSPLLPRRTGHWGSPTGEATTQGLDLKRWELRDAEMKKAGSINWLWRFKTHDGSMVLVYMLTKRGYIDGIIIYSGTISFDNFKYHGPWDYPPNYPQLIISKKNKKCKQNPNKSRAIVPI